MTPSEKNLAQTIARKTYQRVPGQSKASAFREACKWFGVFDKLELQDYALDIYDRTVESIKNRNSGVPHPWNVRH